MVFIHYSFTRCKSFPNFCYNQIAVSITLSSGKMSNISYNFVTCYFFFTLSTIIFRPACKITKSDY